ncbi:MAG: thiamine diphosphokinase [Chloroflexi bacterium]|nr:thiamine diphosphokinase [Chloroflexota bacterium]
MRAILFANGQLSHPDRARELVQPDDLVLCADGGARHALALGLIPDLVVGDLDSLNVEDRKRLDAFGARIERHPVDKDATDLELALLAARRLGANEAVVLAALGGRLDQQMANVLLMASPKFADLCIRLVEGPETAWIVRERLVIHGRKGDTVSALALSPEVIGLTYHRGLRWMLNDFTLPFGSTHGISNEMTANEAEISLRRGVLLVIHRMTKRPFSSPS